MNKRQNPVYSLPPTPDPQTTDRSTLGLGNRGASGRASAGLTWGARGGGIALIGAKSDSLGPGATDVATDRGSELLDLAGVLGFQSARLTILALDRFVHLLAMYADLDGGRDPQSDLIAPDIHHGDDNVIPNDDAFVVCRDRTSIFRAPSSCQRARPVTVHDPK